MELFKELEVKKEAKFSPCKKHRYSLTRTWNASKGHVMFIGLNPSTANELKDDPTIKRVTSFAKDWGYGGVVMCNLFTMVTAYPKELVIDEDIEVTKKCISNEIDKCGIVVFAWGNFKQAINRGKQISNWLKEGYALQINKNGSPKHPLYVKSNVKLVKYKTDTTPTF